MTVKSRKPKDDILTESEKKAIAKFAKYYVVLWYELEKIDREG